MARGEAYIHLVGNVGSELVMRKAGDADVVDVSLAVNTSKDGAATWYRCTFWRNNAKIATDFIKKGDRLSVSGTLVVEEWKAKDGTMKTSLKVDVNRFLMLGGKNDAAKSDEPAPHEPAPHDPPQREIPQDNAGRPDDVIPF